MVAGGDNISMRTFDELVDVAERVDLGDWDFSVLDGRATEERPEWGYTQLMAQRLASVNSALDIDTGTGAVLAEAAVLPPQMVAVEAWPPSLARARERLGPRGVEVVASAPGAPLPLAEASFDLVTSRHPVAPDLPEIARVLAPGGSYLAQHVGQASAFELIEFILGPQPTTRAGRDPEADAATATARGLTMVQLRKARCRMEFHDIGAVVLTLRLCPWWVADFTVERHRQRLQDLDALIRRDGSFVAHSTRVLFEARKPSLSRA